MLVLSRKRSEALVITVPGFAPIRVVVVEHLRGKVRLGVDAAKEILIMREELLRPDGGAGSDR